VNVGQGKAHSHRPDDAGAGGPDVAAREPRPHGRQSTVGLTGMPFDRPPGGVR
jgi:hypothetical protein